MRSLTYERRWCDREVMLEDPVGDPAVLQDAHPRGDRATRRHAAERVLGSEHPPVFALVAIRERAVALEGLCA